MKKWQNIRLVLKRFMFTDNRLFIFALGILIFNFSSLFSQITKEEIIVSKSASLSIDFTQSPNPNDQLNVISTSGGLMPIRQDQEGFYLSGIESIPITKSKPFLTLATVAGINNYAPDIVRISVRFSPDQIVWSPWEEVEDSHDINPNLSEVVSNMITVDTIHKFFSYMVEFSQVAPPNPIPSITNLRFDFFSPGDVNIVDPNNLSGTNYGSVNEECGCDLPNFATRSDWNCPDGNAASCSSPQFAPVSHLIVHHSAGSNSSSNWAAVVLSIWNLHVNTNNWCDVGYNWLIDPNGVIYEGRGGGNNVRGAHFCGANTGTMGICLMGNFENGSPTEAAKASLVKLLTWKSCDAEIDPLGVSLHQSSNKNIKVISGHREGCSTVCPGANLFSELPSIRTDVQNELMICQDGSTEIGEYFDQKSFQIFPNPNQGNFVVSWESEVYQKGKLQMINNLGQIINSREINLFAGDHQEKIESFSAPTGLYQIRLITEKYTITRKMVLSN